MGTIAAAVAAGQEVPCVGPGGEAWTSDDREDQELAADRCLDCPALALCGAYASLAGERAGVWGGQVRESGPVRAHRKQGVRPKKRPAPGPCTCGCGVMTRGGWYVSGHDGVHLAALLAAVRRRELHVSHAIGALHGTPGLQAKLRQFLQ
ncbi:WhiB family transcriptional regulator [Microbacterium rhizomatis]|uniref:WhiB family transcriptional regulator n=1 Tax=Microbacterium rhizomatis TaxID=1631477 RepID=UPI003CCCCD76